MTTGEAKAEFRLAIQQILLEDVQFRHNGNPLQEDPKKEFPPTEVSMSLDVLRPQNDQKAAARLVVVSEAPEGPYSYSVRYLILFGYEGESPSDLDKRLAVTGANMLLPFVRELVANLSSRGRFGPTWISPTNFNKAIGERLGEVKPRKAVERKKKNPGED